MHVVLQNNFSQSAVSSNQLKEPAPAGLVLGILNLNQNFWYCIDICISSCPEAGVEKEHPYLQMMNWLKGGLNVYDMCLGNYLINKFAELKCVPSQSFIIRNIGSP